MSLLNWWKHASAHKSVRKNMCEELLLSLKTRPTDWSTKYRNCLVYGRGVNIVLDFSKPLLEIQATNRVAWFAQPSILWRMRLTQTAKRVYAKRLKAAQYPQYKAVSSTLYKARTAPYNDIGKVDE